MPETMNLKALQEQMDSSPFIQSSGMQITDADHESEVLTMTMPLKPEFERGVGTGQFHGGPIAAFIDTAGCFAPVSYTHLTLPTILLV